MFKRTFCTQLNVVCDGTQSVRFTITPQGNVTIYNVIINNGSLFIVFSLTQFN
jgi:hypothetical protein